MSATIEVKADRRPRVTGFTLLELLVVLAILSLIAGLVFPSVDKALRRQTFLASAHQVELGLRAARALAVGSDMPVRFAILRDGHGFRYSKQEHRLPDTSVVTVRDGGMTFFSDGSAEGGEVDIVDGTLRRRFAVRPVLGTVERVQ